MVPQLHIDYLQILTWLGSTSARVSIFILLFLPLMYVTRNKLKARFQYLLWCFVFVSLLLPWTIQSPISIYNLSDSLPLDNLTHAFKISLDTSDSTYSRLSPDTNYPPASVEEQGTSVISDSSEPALGMNSNALSADAGSNLSISTVPLDDTALRSASFLPPFLFFLWLGGMMILIFSTIRTNRRFVQRLQGRPVTEPRIIAAYEQARQTLCCRKSIPLIMTNAVKTPSLFGVFRSRLLLPAGVLDSLSPDQLRHVFIHELTHYQRKDIPFLWAANCLRFIYWFNPLIWYGFHQMRETQELACDEAVLSRIGSDRIVPYCLTLLSLSETCSSRPRLVNATSLSGSKSQLKKRITLLHQFGKTPRKWTLSVFLLVIILASVTLSNAMAETTVPSAPASQEDPQVNPLIQVNSMTPITLNMDLVEKAKNLDDIPEFTVAGDSDIASIANGWLLRYADNMTYNPSYNPSYNYNPEIDWEKLYPTKPLLVHSYEIGYPDYYLVPFVQEGLFAARATVAVMNKDRTTVRFDDGQFLYPFVDKFLRMDISRAMDLISEEKGLSEVPIPRLVFHRDLTGLSAPNDKLERASLEPAWEFVLDDGSRLYVNQKGQVLDKDVIPWYEKLTTPPYNPENTIIEANKLVRDDGWSLIFEKLVISGPYPSDPYLQSLEIYCRAENNSGADQLFMPRGSIVSITAASGKTYPFGSVELDKTYIGIQQMRLEQNETAITAGQLKLGMMAEAEAADTQFTYLTYQDENGRDFQIPLNLTPEFTQQKPDNTLNIEPYPVPGKDWGIALSRLEFRWGDWTDKKVAFLILSLVNNQGPDQTFLPTGIITGIVGSSGKLYPEYGPNSLAEMYHGREAYFAERGRPMYQPGILQYAPEILVDAGEETITKVIYRDDTGKEYEIPLQEAK